MMALSSLYGVKLPKGVRTEDELMRLQNTVGVPATGVWDSSSQVAYEKYLRRFGVPLTTAYQVKGYAAPGMVRNQRDVKIMQEALGNVTVDGIWGPETDGAYKARIGAENGPANAFSLPISSSAEIAARIAERLDQISSNTGNKSVPVPVVDSKASLPYTGSGTIPKVRPYQQTIAQALMRPAASATAARTTNAGNKPDLGKQTVKSRPIVKPSESMPNAYTDSYDEYPRSYGAARPVKGKVPKPSETLPNADTDSREPEPEVTLKVSDYRPFRLFDSEGDAVVNASNMLNLTTARENSESCCNLYSAIINGERVYFTGQVFIGNQFDVVVPYSTYALWEKQKVLAGELYDLEDIQFEGFMHAHPYNDWSNFYSGGIGDAAVALLSGSIFLTTPDGNIYDLARPEDLLEKYIAATMETLFPQLMQTPINAADMMQNANDIQAFLDWYANPPEIPYASNLNSIDTRKISGKDNNIYHDVNDIFQQIVEIYMEEIYQQYKYVMENMQWAPRS